MRYLRALTILLVLFLWTEAIIYAHGQVPVYQQEIPPYPPTCLEPNTIGYVPEPVKAAITQSIKESNSPTASDKTGRYHEEGGMFGRNKDGALILLISKSGVANPTTAGKTELSIGDFRDPSLASELVSIEGEWHIHPAGTYTFPDGRVSVFVQAPSAADLSLAVCPINIVIGARDKMVYFYDSKGVIRTIKFKEFFKETK